MSLFDNTDDADESYYEASDEFQRVLLRNAHDLDEHPIALIAMRQASALDTLEDFTNQEPLITTKERVAIESDLEEAREALHRAYKVIPPSILDEEEEEVNK